MKYDEVIDRIKSGNFAGKHGFDLQLLVNLIGTLGEMLRNGYTITQVQEPRVMTLEGLQCAHDDEVPVWFESRGTWHGRKGFWIFVYDVNNEKKAMRYNAAHMCSYGSLGLGAYNKTWRCWTSRPTDAQREATPW